MMEVTALVVMKVTPVVMEVTLVVMGVTLVAPLWTVARRDSHW